MRDFRPMNTPGYQQDWQAREAERAAREKEIRADYAARNCAMYPLAGMIAVLLLTLLLGIFQMEAIPADSHRWALVLTAALGPLALAKIGFCFIAMDHNRGRGDYRGRIPAPHRREMLAGSLQLCLLALLTAPNLLFGNPALDFLLPFLGEKSFLPPGVLIPLFNAPALLLTTCAVDRLTCRPRPG